MTRWTFPEDRKELNRWLIAPRRGYGLFWNRLQDYIELERGSGHNMMRYRIDYTELLGRWNWRLTVAMALRALRKAQRRAKEKTW